MQIVVYIIIDFETRTRTQLNFLTSNQRQLMASILIQKHSFNRFITHIQYVITKKTVRDNKKQKRKEIENENIDLIEYDDLLDEYLSVFKEFKDEENKENGGLYFKLSIERNGDYLQFFWQEFGKDFTFANCKAQEETLIYSLKQKSIELEQLCKKDSIIYGIKLEENGKNLSSKFTHCYNTDFQKKSYHVSCIGFNVTVDMNCQLCGTMDSYSNQSKGTSFSHLVVASTLASGMNHYAMQTALAVMGITTQSSEESAKRTLKAAITHIITKGKKALTIGFDYSWSHSRNAKQASGEFIYLKELEDYGLELRTGQPNSDSI
ncbi:hypothetical protein C1646_773135 [Rhizophagus diaphanus]|nr:hypothetical protein C1646_773135 [Rhizophagus diaphanus] [Rhizophagus sp. MUCL 43196]